MLHLFGHNRGRGRITFRHALRQALVTDHGILHQFGESPSLSYPGVPELGFVKIPIVILYLYSPPAVIARLGTVDPFAPEEFISVLFLSPFDNNTRKLSCASVKTLPSSISVDRCRSGVGPEPMDAILVLFGSKNDVTEEKSLR